MNGFISISLSPVHSDFLLVSALKTASALAKDGGDGAEIRERKKKKRCKILISKLTCTYVSQITHQFRGSTQTFHS